MCRHRSVDVPKKNARQSGGLEANTDIVVTWIGGAVYLQTWLVGRKLTGSGSSHKRKEEAEKLEPTRESNAKHESWKECLYSTPSLTQTPVTGLPLKSQKFKASITKYWYSSHKVVVTVWGKDSRFSSKHLRHRVKVQLTRLYSFLLAKHIQVINSR